VKKVLYVCKIGKIGSIDKFDPYFTYDKYVPEWRKEDWNASIEISHGFWILMEKIKELLKPQEISNFRKFENNEELRHGAYPYAIIKDPKYQAI